ncbi:MAG TPA: HEAT repeat domain-containing protein [Candidatus Aminicenantes bacterium]|nr:HEAT repeat domain-containing protein [Candidatus Aminicenantes bacterium]HRY66336.1 HEAT repeat domain-containing protein [Candidatus Aminicenantes bacterium]HRZ73263.1 HEAT repeat domain-containing protein [Candidatus Aminicenantes bacterium]
MKNPRRSIAAAALLLFASLSFAPVSAAGQADANLAVILKGLQTFDTSDVGPAMALHAYVFSHKDDAGARRETEAALLEFIQGSPAPGGLMAACRALRLIAGPASVPVLAALALKPETTAPARYALERIPGGEADRALLGALDQAKGDVRRGVVFSLGERRSAAVVPALTRLAAGPDAILAADAVKALGKTGGPAAIQALVAALGRSSASMRSEIASALMLAAEQALASGDKAAAASVYDKVFAAGATPVSRQAAFKGRIATASDPKDMILKALTGKEALLYTPALAMVPANFAGPEVAKIAGLMDKLPAANQVQLTALLAKYPAETVRPYLLAAAENPSLDVRLAALRAIAAAGDGKSVIFLATKAARAGGAEQDLARDALARLRGLDVDAAVLEHLSKTSDEAVKAELVRAAGERRIAAAKPALMEAVKSGPPSLRSRAAAALRTICVQGDIPGLLDLLAGLDDEQARETMIDTAAAVARANPRELARAGEVKVRLAAEKDPQNRADLLRVLGKIGDDSALAMVRTSRHDPDPAIVDAAVRALADWPTAAARDDVFEIARTSGALNHKVLSTRAYVRMIGLEPNRAPEAATADLVKVLALSPRPEEKMLVLGMLGRFPCAASLKTAESLLDDASVAAEAKAVVDRIRRSL